MKTKELMIGDWVYGTETKKYGIVDKLEHDVEDDTVEPIPITEEILKKNGFEKSNNVSDTQPYDKDEEGNMHYSYNNKFWGWLQPNGVLCIPANALGFLEFKYVHELQHALRLCKIDKEIEL